MDNINIEGVVLHNKPLSDIELEDAAKRLNIPNFRGCNCRMLPKLHHRDECGFLNLDNSRGDGTHWTSWYVTGQAGEGDKGKKIYFDSYGVDPPLE
jgi:hypothetical protein